MKVKHLYTDQELNELPQVQMLRERLAVPETLLTHPGDIYKRLQATPDPIRKGKEILHLTTNKGVFIKECPGTRNYTCCDYRILHIGSFCSLDCAYCILQAYFHPPVLQYFMNHASLFKELDDALSSQRLQRFGTGEFTDSLIWEPISGLTPNLIRKFAQQSHSILELKTKTVLINHLQDLPHNQKTILSWSLNSEKVIAENERHTAPLKARLAAARRAVSWGYRVAFHFDPLILYPGCQNDYQRVIDALFKQIPQESIVWISMGAFRFMPDLKPIIQKRFAASTLVYGEFITGLDGKMRYFKPLRIKLYQTLINQIRWYGPDVTTYLCMEDDEVWDKAMGFLPASRGGLKNMLDESAMQHCALVG